MQIGSNAVGIPDSNYIVNFSIPKLSEEDKAYILSSPPANELNAFIWRKYDIDVSQIN